MIVCIAEKPSVARDIAHVIGATQAKQGYIEGNGYQVTWTYGHLCTLKEPNDYNDQWKHWALSALPMIPHRFGIKLIEQEHITKQFAIVEKLMKNADSRKAVITATMLSITIFAFLDFGFFSFLPISKNLPYALKLFQNGS